MSEILTNVVILALALLMTVMLFTAKAEVVWENGKPIFKQDRYRYRSNPWKPKVRRSRPQRTRRFDPGGRPQIDPVSPQAYYFPNDLKKGTVIIDTKHKQLYYVMSGIHAFIYPISVGRQGFAWTGVEKVSRVADWPSWHPPAEMRRRQRGLPVKMEGGLNNPLGAKAIYLGNTLYRIHGTNDPKSIGKAASSGCFRMLNKHVMHLASLIKIGTTVYVIRSMEDLK